MLEVEEERETAGEVLDGLVEREQPRGLPPRLVEVDGGEHAAGREEQVVAEHERAVGAAGHVDLEPGEVERQRGVEAGPVVGAPGAGGRQPGVADELHRPMVAGAAVSPERHPTALGQERLAEAVMRAVPPAG